MITKHCLTSEWINEVSARYNNADKVLVEKVIRALLLLEGLAEAKLPFVFKGGTALMLLMNSSKRLSIDIDIIMPDSKGLDEAVAAIANAKDFTKAVLQHRNTRFIKCHALMCTIYSQSLFLQMLPHLRRHLRSQQLNRPHYFTMRHGAHTDV